MTGKKQDNEKDLQESFDRALESLINGSKRNDSDIQGPRRDIGPRPTPSDGADE